MFAVHLTSASDFAGWRAAARRLASHRISDAEADWLIEGSSHSLFAAGSPPPASDGRWPVAVPKRFLGMAERAACHRDPARFARLYRILVRLQDDPRLIANAADADIAWLMGVEKNVRRDIHKTHAFVRFRKTGERGGRECFVAWFEPEYRSLKLSAGFFQRRFTGMDWAILTPEESVRWDGERLEFGGGAAKSDAPADDAMEEHWRVYFSSIFNPARLKVSAMTSEMPMKYWKNLPEAELIPHLISDAPRRAREMAEKAVTDPSELSRRLEARKSGPCQGDPETLEEARKAVQSCARCGLCEHATQAVFGEGSPEAPLMIVGEQPGDEEDLAGRPFVGPAGQVLDRALEDGGVDRAQAYVTNAVKHFKFTLRGKKRIHAKPNAGEIDACRFWLGLERDFVKPKVVLALGASAARGVLGQAVKVSDVSGKWLSGEGAAVRVTTHPSYLLRLPDPEARAEALARFVADIRAVADRVSAGK